MARACWRRRPWSGSCGPCCGPWRSARPTPAGCGPSGGSPRAYGPSCSTRATDMQQLTMARIEVRWPDGKTSSVAAQYNPNELTFEKGVQIAEIAIPGLDTPLLQFVRGQNERLTL